MIIDFFVGFHEYCNYSIYNLRIVFEYISFVSLTYLRVIRTVLPLFMCVYISAALYLCAFIYVQLEQNFPLFVCNYNRTSLQLYAIRTGLSSSYVIRTELPSICVQLEKNFPLFVCNYNRTSLYLCAIRKELRFICVQL